MSVFDKGTITIVAVAAVLAMIAVPLALRRVPPNVVYGFRTRKTLSDEKIWYDANAHFGRGLVVASVVSIVTILILDRTELLSPHAFLNVSLAALVVPALTAALATARFIRSIGAR